MNEEKEVDDVLVTHLLLLGFFDFSDFHHTVHTHLR